MTAVVCSDAKYKLFESILVLYHGYRAQGTWSNHTHWYEYTAEVGLHTYLAFGSRNELVQAQNPKFRHATNAALVATRMSHIWYHTDRHKQWKRVTWPFFFCQGPRTSASSENVPRPQAFKEVNNSQAFTVGRKTMTQFFSGRAASRCSKACLYKVSRKYSKN